MEKKKKKRVYIPGSKWDHKCPKQCDKGYCQGVFYVWAETGSTVNHTATCILTYTLKLTNVNSWNSLDND